MTKLKSKTRNAVVFFAGLMGLGTIGYRLIEGWPLLDSLYMTVITMSTVGFGEPRPLSPLGKLFTGALILLGVGTLAYIATKTTETLLDRTLLRTGRMKREIKRMRGHVIVCGYGRMGSTVVKMLQDRGAEIVVIDKESALGERLDLQGTPYLVGDATEDAVLNEAGIDRARALASVLPHDADNLFVTVTSRGLNPSLTIIARASQTKNDVKMIRAGATRVLNPYRHGGRLMAQQLLQPAVTEFIEVVSRWGDADLCLEEVQIRPDSELAGVSLQDAPIRKEMDVIIVGIRRPDGGLVFNPASDLSMGANDTLIALGGRENLHRLAQVAAGERGGGSP